MTNLDSVLKSRSITLPTKVCLVTAMVFPVVMYGCESWTIKKSERHRIDAFELWCLRRLLRVPSTATSSNQSILKEINLEYSLEGLMLKLRLQNFGPLCKEMIYWKRLWCWEQWKAGEEDEMVGWHHNSMDMSSSKLQEILKDRSAWWPVVHGVSNSQARLSDWKTSFKKNPKKPNRT